MENKDNLKMWTNKVNRFSDMNLPENLLKGIYCYGFDKPSAIQQRAITALMTGNDLISHFDVNSGQPHRHSGKGVGDKISDSMSLELLDIGQDIRFTRFRGLITLKNSLELRFGDIAQLQQCLTNLNVLGTLGFHQFHQLFFGQKAFFFSQCTEWHVTFELFLV